MWGGTAAVVCGVDLGAVCRAAFRLSQMEAGLGEGAAAVLEGAAGVTWDVEGEEVVVLEPGEVVDED